MSLYKKSILLILVVLFIDQTLKFWIKTNLMLGEEIHVLGSWFILHFTENNGMAFGLELAGEFGKIILSLFRIAAVCAIGWYLHSLIKEKVPQGLVLSIALILAGAIGNIIDSAFYGMIFNESYGQLASLFPEEGGYSSFLHGRVVDMFYFPIIDTHLPSWFPVWANKHFVFFRPVFNIADSAITVGVSIILIFQKRFFKSH